MANIIKVLVEYNGFSKTLLAIDSDGVAKYAGCVPILNSRGKIDNTLLEAILPVAKSLNWTYGVHDYLIADGSSGKGPRDETIEDTTNAANKWQEGFPVLFGYKGGETVGVRVDSARNADSVGDAVAGDATNSEANRVVQTDDGGVIAGTHATHSGKAIVEGLTAVSKQSKLYWDHRIVAVNSSGKIELASAGSTNVVGVVSYDAGMIVNYTAGNIGNFTDVPVVVCGTALVQAANISNGNIGDFVGAGDGGLAVVSSTLGNIVGKIIGFDSNRYYKIMTCLK